MKYTFVNAQIDSWEDKGDNWSLTWISQEPCGEGKFEVKMLAECQLEGDSQFDWGLSKALEVVSL